MNHRPLRRLWPLLVCCLLLLAACSGGDHMYRHNKSHCDCPSF